MPDYEPPTTDDLPHDPHDGRPSLDDAPARVGRYRILEPLGEGGFGVVYRAEQAEPVRRQVALKVIKPGMDSKAVVSRFEAERQALALMDHPCVAKIYDGGVTDEGRPYFAMELVKGEPITTHCDRQRLGVRARIELFIRVCEAIQHAHHKGVVHRDLKPSNILVEYESGKATPKVIDFGVAKALHQRLTEATIFTGQGQMIGTPEYMSPEQAEMSGADIDTRSDVYSLGVLLYELLTGVRPFDSESLRQAALAEIQRIIREVDPPKPSTRLSTAAEAESVAASRNTEVRSLSGVLRRDLDWVCMKCLEKDRERRYDTANALAEDLRRFLSDEPVAAGPPSASYRLRKFVRRNRSGVLATGAVVAVAVTGAVVASVGWSRALDGQRQAKDALVDLVRESLRDGWDDPVLRDRMDRAGLDIALSEENGERRFFVDVEGSDSIPRLAGFTREVYGWLEESERLASAEAERAAAAEAEAKERAEQLQIVADFQAEQLGAIDAAKMGLDLRNTLVDLYADRLERGGLPEDEAAAQAEALDASLSGVDFTGLALGSLEANVFVPALDAIDRQFEDQPLVRAQLQQTLAIVLRDAGLLEAAEEPQRAALEGYRRVLGDEHRDTLGSISNMGFLLRAKGKFTEAEPYYREALEGYRRVLGDEHRDTLGSISHMGFLLRAKGKFTEAEPYYREALEAHRRVLGGEHPSTLNSINNMGMLLRARGKLTEAEPYFREALEARRVLGDEHMSTLISINNMGALLQSQGKLNEAEPYHREALEARRRMLGDEHPSTLISINNMGGLLGSQSKLSEAEPYYREALEARRRVLGGEHPSTLASISNLGALLRSQGKLSEAEPYFREALEGYRRVLGDEHPNTLTSINNMGALLLSQGKPTEAEPYYRETLEGYRRVLGDEHRRTLISIGSMGTLLLSQGNLTEAEPYLREALEECRRVLGDEHLDTLASINNVGALLEKQGRLVESLDLLLPGARTAEETLPKQHSLVARLREKVARVARALHEAEPEAGYNAIAVEWEAKLEAADTEQQTPEPSP